ncbi:MAG: OmpA family protein [Bacteroidetes bacterium]|nr:OmpA family protein [Bacteroidota bacterium]
MKRRDAQLLDKAEFHFQKQEYPTAIALLQQYVQRRPDEGHAWMLLGEAGLETGDNALAFNAFERALMIDSLRYRRALAMVGELHLRQEQYSQATTAFARALASGAFRENERMLLQERFKISEFRQQLVSNPHPVLLHNAGTPLNTPDDEIPNSILLDGSRLLFTRKQNSGGRDRQQPKETFLITSQNQGQWSEPDEFMPWRDSGLNMGAPALAPDGNALWFAGCGWPGGLGSCDLYVSYFEKGAWSLPVNTGPQINTAAWESQPAISVDCTTLIFASNRPGGYGGSDLYQAVRLPDGRWSSPQNLGPLINTAGNEMAPFFHPDGITLYFSSDGHPGMGGFDLFMTRLDLAGRWSAPFNLGVPINSPADELNLVTDARGAVAWMAAQRPGGMGGYDMYSFELPAELRPQPLRTVKLRITDAINGRPIRAFVRVNALSDGSLFFEGSSRDTDGILMFPLPEEAAFALFAGSEGYLYFSEQYVFEKDDSEPQLSLEIKLMPALEGQRMVLKNIYFAFNSAELLPESRAALEHLLEFFRQNNDWQAEIAGHTDSVGTPAFNKRLSLMRALAVRDWLIQQGVDPQRLVAVGYGADQPSASNATEEGRAQNRRTEIVLRKRL